MDPRFRTIFAGLIFADPTDNKQFEMSILWHGRFGYKTMNSVLLSFNFSLLQDNHFLKSEHELYILAMEHDLKLIFSSYVLLAYINTENKCFCA